jgi:hypothetical protein
MCALFLLLAEVEPAMNTQKRLQPCALRVASISWLRRPPQASRHHGCAADTDHTPPCALSPSLYSLLLARRPLISLPGGLKAHRVTVSWRGRAFSFLQAPLSPHVQLVSTQTSCDLLAVNIELAVPGTTMKLCTAASRLRQTRHLPCTYAYFTLQHSTQSFIGASFSFRARRRG